jgi:hypothetical protein
VQHVAFRDKAKYSEFIDDSMTLVASCDQEQAPDRSTSIVCTLPFSNEFTHFHAPRVLRHTMAWNLLSYRFVHLWRALQRVREDGVD